ncbi:MAG: hypothetical protein KGL39_08060 [Patescibacteria group bacterium]|nr:hypothetical protein [Patescibacteria group bacterium]
MKLFAFLIAPLLALLLSLPTQAGGYEYGGYYPSYGYSYYGYSSYGNYGGYSYWPGGVWNVDGRYYAPGYYKYYYPATVAVYTGVPVYYPVAVTSANPAVVAPADPRQLAAIPDPKGKVVGACEKHVAELKARMDAMEKKVAAPPVPAVMPPAQAAAPVIPAVLASARLSCTPCHDATNAATKGGKFVVTKDGQFVPFDDHALLAIFKRVVLRKEMPPKDNKEGVAPLTDQAGDAWIQFVDQTKGTVKP